MRIKFGARAPAVAAALCLALLAPAFAQVGHPLKGSWLGFWGPGQKEQRRLILLMNWKDRQVTAVLNPGPKQVVASRADIDYGTWMLDVEANMPDAAGKPQKWIATGKVENLGSWTNRRYSGTYTWGKEQGKFSVTLH
jgi:hypothetical protein